MRKERRRFESYSDNAEQEDMVDGGSHVQILHRRVRGEAPFCFD